MAHVWNVTDGDIYVSKNGDDVSGDGTSGNPYASINKATDSGTDGDKIVIGTGLWAEARGTSLNRYRFVGDGNVVFDGSGASVFNTTLYEIGFEGIRFVGYDSVKLIFTTGNTSLHTVYFERCEIDARLHMYGVSTVNTTHPDVIFRRCLIDIRVYNQGYYPVFFIQNCTVLRLITEGLTGERYRLLSFIDNAIMGEVTGINASSIAVWINAVIHPASIVDVPESSTVIYLDPKFNDPDVGDYTLRPDSPCLFAGKNGGTVGAFGLGYSFNANSAEFTEQGGAVFSQTTGVNDIIRTSQTVNGVIRHLFQLASGHTSGNVETAWIDFQAIRYLLITRLFTNIIYNSSGVATSRPANLEEAGEKAVYYDFELKWCNDESEKATAVFKSVIWSKAVTIDSNGNGNADPAFLADLAQYISARYVKIKLYMTEA